MALPNDHTVGFLSTLSQAIAALLALLIAAMLFTFERIKQGKQAAYEFYKSEMANLIRLHRERPEAVEIRTRVRL